MSKNRRLALIIIKLALSLPVLVLLTVIFHEGAHYVTALILGVPIANFVWFDPNYLSPVIKSASVGYPIETQIVGYAGGLVTGASLLAVLALKRDWFRKSLYKWFLGLSIATFGFWQIPRTVRFP